MADREAPSKQPTLRGPELSNDAAQSSRRIAISASSPKASRHHAAIFGNLPHLSLIPTFSGRVPANKNRSKSTLYAPPPANLLRKQRSKLDQSFRESTARSTATKASTASSRAPPSTSILGLLFPRLTRSYVAYQMRKKRKCAGFRSSFIFLEVLISYWFRNPIQGEEVVSRHSVRKLWTVWNIPYHLQWR